MSFATKLRDAAFASPLRGKLIQDRSALAGEYILGSTEAESIYNHADPSNPLTVQGSPTYNAHSANVRSSLSAGFGFKSGIILDDDATLIVIRENPSIGTAPIVVGSKDGIYGMREFGANYASNGENANNKGANRTTPANGVVYFEALVCSQQNVQRTLDGYGKLYYYSAGIQQVATSVDLGVVTINARTQICIGSNSLTDTITNNSIKVYYVAINQRRMTADEIDDAYDRLVAFYADLGVTVV